MKIPFRAWIALMIFFGAFMNYMVRTNISVSIIAMSKKPGNKTKPECMSDSEFNKTEAAMKKHPEVAYKWSEYINGLMLGGYGYGYVVLCLPSGAIADRWGPFKVLFWTNIVSAIVNALTPPLASVHWSLAFIVRIILGCMGALTYPSLQGLITNWAPPDEKGKFSGALFGNTIGVLVTWPLVGVISEDLIWTWGFYVTSLFCVGYAIIFWVICTDRPEGHRWISKEELEYIKSAQGTTVSSEKVLPPYRSIFLSIPVWAIIIAQFGNLWGLFLFLTGIPKFMSEVMGFNLQSSGGLGALPQLSRFIFGLVFGSIGDMFKRNNYLRVINIRRSHLIPALILICMKYTGCNKYLVVLMLIVSMVFNSAVTTGHILNGQDLAPNFASTVYGIMSFFGGVTTFLVPSVNAFFIANHNGLNEWHQIFNLGGCMYFISGVLFIIFCSGELQPWNQKDGTGTLSVVPE